MIQLRVKELMFQKGLRPTAHSLFKFGIPYSTGRQIIDGSAKMIKLVHIERLCIGLRCTPKEILGVYSTEASPIPPDAPLYTWIGQALPFPLAQYRNLTPEQLDKAGAFLQELISGEV